MKIYIFSRKKAVTVILVLITLILISAAIATVINLQNTGVVEALQLEPIYQGPDSVKAVSFTCNVDWGNEYIPKMLEIFRKEKIKAAFFVTGRWADKYPELLEVVYREGHIIGNHGYYHKDHSKLSYEQNIEEIARAQETLERVTGERPLYFAPPSGAYNKHTLRAAQDMGYKVIMWSIDTIDWKRDGVDKIVERVNRRLKKGGIVLMHPTDQTVEALPVIIKNIREAGFKIIPLDQLVEMIENS